MTGDTQDILARLKATLPTRWFADSTPVLDGLLTGLSATWSWLYGALAYTKLQTRIASATDTFLDVISADFFGQRLPRRPAEPDPIFSARIQREMLRPRDTRAALTKVLTDLTSRAPLIFEPSRPADTGAWCETLGYGVAGGWGSLLLPFQCFVTAYRGQGSGIADVAGYGQGNAGYGIGLIEYASLSMLPGEITDADITQAIASVMPVSTIAWTRISN
jgi:hypothetical protein